MKAAFSSTAGMVFDTHASLFGELVEHIRRIIRDLSVRVGAVSA